MFGHNSTASRAPDRPREDLLTALRANAGGMVLEIRTLKLIVCRWKQQRDDKRQRTREQSEQKPIKAAATLAAPDDHRDERGREPKDLKQIHETAYILNLLIFGARG